ncbi:MAG TPA: hypothetical protein VKV06_04305 [Acidimicrobiales bacterium]|nr:hypothetical protein [Acidimicrobiales bacterium]
MTEPYPGQLLPREPAPPYEGEGPFALWHFSEDPSIGHFEPHRPATNPTSPPLVWAVDTRHAPMYWFPRNCPRGCIWPVSTTTSEDRERFFGPGGGADRVHVLEGRWLEQMRRCRLWAYRLPKATFRPDAGAGGYWVSDRPVDPEPPVAVGDLLDLHVAAGIEVRVVPSLAPWWRAVVASTVEFSGIRLANAVPRP